MALFRAAVFIVCSQVPSHNLTQGYLSPLWLVKTYKINWFTLIFYKKSTIIAILQIIFILSDTSIEYSKWHLIKTAKKSWALHPRPKVAWPLLLLNPATFGPVLGRSGRQFSSGPVNYKNSLPSLAGNFSKLKSNTALECKKMDARWVW